MTIVEEHTSPDGLLRIRVQSDEAGDLSLGFEGYSWHTHGDILAKVSGLSQPNAVKRFLQELLSGESVIAILRVGGNICDIWVSDNPNSDERYPIAAESIELRHWDGRKWTGN